MLSPGYGNVFWKKGENTMMGDDENDDLMDDFLEYDIGMGSDTVTCPDCGEKISASLFLDDEVECPSCGRKIIRK